MSRVCLIVRGSSQLRHVESSSTSNEGEVNMIEIIPEEVETTIIIISEGDPGD